MNFVWWKKILKSDNSVIGMMMILMLSRTQEMKEMRVKQKTTQSMI